MKPGKSVEIKEEIVEVHTAARSPSPKQKAKERPPSDSESRKLSNGHVTQEDAEIHHEEPSEKSKNRENWTKSEQESLDTELPIHDQIKMGILGFVEKEIKKSDKNPSFVFYSHDPNGLDERFMKTLSRPSSGHKEKRSPSYRKKKRHSSRHRDRDLHDFEIPGSSLIALEKVDDYLKEYNKDEEVTLSGELEIEANDVENNNGSSKELKHKPRKTRRKLREERYDTNANGKDISPKVFKTGTRSKTSNKAARPTDLTTMLESLESNVPYHDQYIDNPFSSPSPLTSPNDDRIAPFGARRPEKIYLQGGGTFRTVSRDRMLESQQSRDDDRIGELTPLDVALTVQKAWRSAAAACHGVLGGLSLLHLLLISYSDSLDATHLSFHALVTMPYVAAYYFFCVLCLLSVLDRLDITSIDLTRGLQPWFQPIVLVILYTACLLVCTAARMYDELMVYQYAPFVANITANATTATIPPFYHTWTHFSIWRAVLSILGLVYFIISNPPDLVYLNLSKLLQFKHSLQSIG
ncbi:transmembrane protein 237 isoform X2 [Bicyclus anynana]|uniref:Transmembrane protein 237 isoform X2 n=1 Tax=Bicyclus anynana TaxID=110368 RepID=A0A6J1NBZ8_BICAN|nr:transmembrane protein 237 isoform X2 [Bicyclus anynana]